MESKFRTPIRSFGNIVVKMESFNSAGSHKSRAARHMIEKAIADGDIEKNGSRRILEKTGGNLGVGLAFEGGRQGIAIDLVIGLSFSPIKKALCKAFGANLVGLDLLNEGKSPREVIDILREQRGDEYFFTDQFNNSANVESHLIETGPEYVEQLEVNSKFNRDKIIMVKAAGTGASFTGIAKALRKKWPKTRCELVFPKGCDIFKNTYSEHKIEGIAVGVEPPFLDQSLVDGITSVTDVEAHNGQENFARELGFYPGMSSGANYHAAKLMASKNPDATIVTVAYDSGESYFRN